jgi:glycosyltransferase involved in cell wall biosynthesis
LGYETLLVAGPVSPDEGDMIYFAETHGVEPTIIPHLGRRLLPTNDFSTFVRILRLLFKFQPDIVHTHTAKAGALGRVAALVYNAARSSKSIAQNQVINGTRGRLKIVHTFHGHVLREYFSPLKSKIFQLIEKILARFTDTIVVISAQQRHELCSDYGIGQPEQYRVIPLGFDLTPVEPSNQSKGIFRKRHNLDQDGVKLVGIVGRLTPVKNHHLFFKAMQFLIQKWDDKVTRCLVVGDGELSKELKNLTKRLNISDRVVFTGWIKEMAPLYADLDVLALTSDNEGTPVTVIEAMAAGVPVVATDVGGVRELISDFGLRNAEFDESEFEICERGVLVRKGDVRGFAKGLKYLLEHPEEGREMGKRGREYALEKHTMERLVSDMDSLYQALLPRNDK